MHCNQCNKIWTLETTTGRCEWCGKEAMAVNKAKIRPQKRSASRTVPEQAPKRYDQLTGDYATYYKIASRYAGRSLPNESEDLLHDIIIKLAEANAAQEYSEPAMYRIASHVKDDYWRRHYKLTMGLDCQNCNRDQIEKCRKRGDYSQCPKLIRLERLNRPIIDSEGNITEYGELIADDSALDVPDWIAVNEQLLHSPARLIEIAEKKRDGIALSNNERSILHRHRLKYQKQLV